MLLVRMVCVIAAQPISFICQNANGLGAVCCNACFSMEVVCCHGGWLETAQTVKTAETAKRYTPLDHTPPY